MKVGINPNWIAPFPVLTYLQSDLTVINEVLSDKSFATHDLLATTRAIASLMVLTR